MNINQDLEAQRIHRNQTRTQIKNSNLVREGVLVNSNVPLNDSYNSMVISDSVELPNKLYEKSTKRERGILPICLTTTGVMGAIASGTALLAKSAKDNINVGLAQKLPSLTRNVCINEEINQAIYRMVASPSKKAIKATLGVASLASMAFMSKTFCDGFRDVWVKKKEADIQKNLQENLIAVETQSFAGKMQINRNMLAEKAKEFSKVLAEKPEPVENFKRRNISFKGQEKMDKPKTEKQSSKIMKNLRYFALGAASLGAIVGLGYVSVKNVKNSIESMKQGREKVKEAIGVVIEQMKGHTPDKLWEEGHKAAKELNSSNIKNLLISIDATPQEVSETAEKLHWHSDDEKKSFIADTLFSIQKSTEKANSALGGSGADKNTFYSHVTDYTAFFYNWLMDSSNKQFKSLFFGVTGATAAAYVGKTSCEAVKDVQVKKYNADTELGLQKRLVSTELRNFKSKKEASIQPLCDEFYKQKANGKSNEDLKVVADSILNEIKNGAPYVYS